MFSNVITTNSYIVQISEGSQKSFLFDDFVNGSLKSSNSISYPKGDSLEMIEIFTGFKCSDSKAKSVCLPDNYSKFELPHTGNIKLASSQTFSIYVNFYSKISQTRLAFPWTSMR